MCKLNAVNDFLLPSLRRALRPLIEAGFVELVSGNVATGTHLAHHELVEVFAMTGSDKTHDAILWGGHGDVGARKADPRAAPNLTKPVSAELGCVVPLIVVPGEWSEAELDRKARELDAQCPIVPNAPMCPNAPMRFSLAAMEIISDQRVQPSSFFHASTSGREQCLEQPRAPRTPS